LSVCNGLLAQVIIHDESVHSIVAEPEVKLADDRGVETRNTYHSPIEVPFKIEYVSKVEHSVDDAICKSADDAMKDIEKKRLEI
jgi:hypothetical protein